MNPVKPIAPVAPVFVVDPGGPVEPVVPVAPLTPVEPVLVADPEIPVSPVAPAAPVEPSPVPPPPVPIIPDKVPVCRLRLARTLIVPPGSVKLLILSILIVFVSKSIICCRFPTSVCNCEVGFTPVIFVAIFCNSTIFTINGLAFVAIYNHVILDNLLDWRSRC